MTKEQCKTNEINLDADGFLVEMDGWNEDVARCLAKKEDIEELTDEMMDIVKFMRTYYKKFNAFPILNYVCKNIHQPGHCVSEKFINPEKAWKIAGLPKLENIHFVSVDGKHYQLEECC